MIQFKIISARRIWQATMKQMMIEEDIALLEHRQTSTPPQQSASYLVSHMIDDIDILLENSNEIMETSSIACSPTNEIERLQVLQQGILHQAVTASRRLAENLNEIVQFEQNKFSSKNGYMESTSEWQAIVFNAIETRRLHQTQRAKFLLQHKLATAFITTTDL